MRRRSSTGQKQPVNENIPLVGGWTAAKIPQVGIYKLVARKRRDVRLEWAHFIQCDNGTRVGVMRGEVASP